MIFNSISYLVFLFIAVLAYYLFPAKIRWVWLLVASFGYYMSFIPVFILLIIGLAAINYFMARLLEKSDEGDNRVFISVVFMNLLVLAFFKYFNNLFPQNHVHLYNVDFFYRNDVISKMLLPLGLSYIIFTVLSYQIEIKRKNIQAERNFGVFSLYLIFFPRIAQGPIERPQNLIPQLRENHYFNYSMIVEGLKMILWGYFKKLVIADRLAIYVNAVYNNSEQHNGTTLTIATFLFAFQIYADFSGYTDIALGSARLFGFRLSNNFNRPYFATSIKEFWNRWHITLSTWLRDYIFLPLAYFMSKRLKKTEYMYVSTDKWIYLIVSLITFGICGIWHGVGWKYFLWGILFGVYLSYSNFTKDWHKSMRKRYNIKKTSILYLSYKVATTFLLVSFAWIIFRANTLSDAVNIITKIFTTAGRLYTPSPYDLIYCLSGIFILMAVELKLEYFSGRWAVLYSKYPVVRISGLIVLVMLILLIGVFDGGQFIYFQF